MTWPTPTERQLSDADAARGQPQPDTRLPLRRRGTSAAGPADDYARPADARRRYLARRAACSPARRGSESARSRQTCAELFVAGLLQPPRAPG